MSNNQDSHRSDTFRRAISDETELRREARFQGAYERLGTTNPKCALCPEANPLCLELHHLEGKDFGGTFAIVCRNCHRKLSDAQKDHPQKIAEPPNLAEVVAHFLMGLADFFELLVKVLRDYAAQLAGIADQNRDNTEPQT